VFLHRQELQFTSTPEKPDAVYTRKLQEVLGGRYGEITIAMQYMFQGWNMAAVAELQEEGAEKLPAPSNFPQSEEHTEVSYQYLNFSDGAHAGEGRWAKGPSPDGNGEFTCHDGPTTSAPMPPPTRPDSRFYGTTELPDALEKVAGAAQDAQNKE